MKESGYYMVADLIDKGINHSQDEHEITFRHRSKDFYDAEDNSVEMADIIRETEIHGIEQKETEEHIRTLSRLWANQQISKRKYSFELDIMKCVIVVMKY